MPPLLTRSVFDASGPRGAELPFVRERKSYHSPGSGPKRSDAGRRFDSVSGRYFFSL